MQPDRHKANQAVELGRRGALERMRLLNPQEFSELGRCAVFAKHRPIQLKQRKERAEEIAELVQQFLNRNSSRERAHRQGVGSLDHLRKQNAMNVVFARGQMGQG